MTIGEVTAQLDRMFRPELQEDYDNAGFLLGDSRTECIGVLVALDLTQAVADEAIALGLNLIVTHHPLIFGGLKRITDGSETGRIALTLVRHGISAYAAHTNLDNLPWGVNGILSEKLGLRNIRILRVGSGEWGVGIGTGMVGELEEPMEAEAFLLKVKEVTGIPFIRTSTSNFQLSTFNLKRVALCGGSGSEFIGDALAAGADIYLTADLKYHDFQRTDGRMLLADIGHYESEQFAKEIIFRCISEKFSNFACRISETQGSLVHYI